MTRIVPSKLVWLLVALFLGCSTVVHGESNTEGVAFLAENAKKPGVVTLPSGLQYKVLEKGSGLYHPLPNSPCSCHYHGTLIDGSTFDSSYDRGSPTTFAPNQVIKGWTEAMQLMVEGDKFELYIPSDLAYGDRGSPPKIPGGSVLVFKIEILEILVDDKTSLPIAVKCDASTGENCNEKETNYLSKIVSWTDEKKSAELNRLGKLDPTQVKPELVEWIQRRTKILEQLVESSKEEL
uniref:peptidylprolyl isomerase n=1 Tax=Amphora coffeiformis TaxID=265554 RepID=A0A7S3P827_9STRA|mmetsp:Transcript_18187/g.34513  ORF Transcript_18187/g.34513 Transcript_18187/m.34513 type:complete len:237 (+) Transcript_18187:107-817(+)